ncbi:hypothetical protein BDV98DRAFT_567188 [Pterulicium gracile]|uniref:Uncharacterized protein n=1 Tax=Pterulicium gracile TaxID=1884261 RepID=A0A5C3QJQ3_9AGAR|nr:hypothetical protein BDV98DRAFT_567188 [Pterula gracilis]
MPPHEPSCQCSQNCDPDYPPSRTLPSHLMPSSTRPPKTVEKLFYGLILPVDVFLAYARRHGLYPESITPEGLRLPLAMRNITTHLSTKYGRLPTSCMPILGPHVGPIRAGCIALYSNRTIPWYFYTWPDDRALIEDMKEDLGAHPDAKAVWCYQWAEFDLQDRITKPDLKKVLARRNKRLKELQRHKPRRRDSVETLKATEGVAALQ